MTNTKCRVDTVISPEDGRMVARNMYRKEINILRRTVHQVRLIYKITRQGDKTCQNLSFHSGVVEVSGHPRVSKTLTSFLTLNPLTWNI